MTERLLTVLLQQALLLSVGVALTGALRPLLLKRLGAGSTYAAWLLVPALLATPLLPRPAQEPLRVVLQATGTADTAALPALPAPPPDQSTTWLALWLAGAALVAATQAGRQWRLARLGPQLPAGSSPALVGLLRPRVALPADFEQRFPPAERELILAHEEVHRRRGDNAWNLLACALTALHWWNPLAWWAARRLRADQELACDAAVLAGRPDAQADYTRALLAAHDLTAHGAPLASRWGTAHPLVERIAMLNRPALTRRRAAALGIALALIGGLAYGVQTGTATPPAGTPRVDVELQLSLLSQDGSAPISLGDKGHRLIMDAGLPGALSIVLDGKLHAHWDIVVFPTLTADDRIRLVFMYQDGKPLKRGAIDSVTMPPDTWTEFRVPSASGGPDLLVRRKARVLPPAAMPLNADGKPSS